MKNHIAVAAMDKGSVKSPLPLIGDLYDSIRIAAHLGYTAIEIHPKNLDDFYNGSIEKQLNKNHLLISAIATGQIHNIFGITYTSCNSSERKLAVEKTKNFIDVAESLNITDGIIIGWIKGNKNEQNASDFDKYLLECLQELDFYARSKNQTLLIEAINRYESNTFNTSNEISDYINRYSLLNCKIHLDSFHMNIEESNMANAIKLAGDRLGYFHIADSNRRGPGKGHINFEFLFQALQEINYKDTISIECHAQGVEEDTARDAINFIKQYL